MASFNFDDEKESKGVKSYMPIPRYRPRVIRNNNENRGVPGETSENNDEMRRDEDRRDEDRRDEMKEDQNGSDSSSENGLDPPRNEGNRPDIEYLFNHSDDNDNDYDSDDAIIDAINHINDQVKKNLKRLNRKDKGRPENIMRRINLRNMFNRQRMLEKFQNPHLMRNSFHFRPKPEEPQDEKMLEQEREMREARMVYHTPAVAAPEPEEQYLPYHKDFRKINMATPYPKGYSPE